MIPARLTSAEVVEFLFVLEGTTDKNEIKALLNNLLQPIGLAAQWHITDQGVHLSLTGELFTGTLIWKPTEKDYSPLLAGINESNLTNIDNKTYEYIWTAINACSKKVWHLPEIQKTILELLAIGKNMEEISIECGLSIPSIKRYVGIVRNTFEAKTNPHAIAIAIRNGWI